MHRHRHTANIHTVARVDMSKTKEEIQSARWCHDQEICLLELANPWRWPCRQQLSGHRRLHCLREAVRSTTAIAGKVRRTWSPPRAVVERHGHSRSLSRDHVFASFRGFSQGHGRYYSAKHVDDDLAFSPNPQKMGEFHINMRTQKTGKFHINMRTQMTGKFHVNMLTHASDKGRLLVGTERRRYVVKKGPTFQRTASLFQVSKHIASTHGELPGLGKPEDLLLFCFS
jgi:hypothetical protein